MRHLLLLACIACSGTPTSAPEPTPDVSALVASVRAWEEDPSNAHLDAVGVAAKESLDAVPPGDVDADVAIARALSEVLLRPDLAHPRLAPHAATLQGTDRDLWRTLLLREGELSALKADLGPEGADLDLEHPALTSAAMQAARFREIDWRRAIRAYRAAELADLQPRKSKPQVDRPLGSVELAFRIIGLLLPDATFEAVTTRSPDPADPPPDTTAGAIPTLLGNRRVIAYATGDASTLPPVGAALDALHPPRVGGYVIRATLPDGQVRMLCSEGRYEADGYWMVSGCQTDRGVALSQAAELWRDLEAAGVDEAGREARIRETWGEALR